MSGEILRVSVCGREKRQAALLEMAQKAEGVLVLPSVLEQPELAWIADVILLDAADAAQLPDEKGLPFCPSLLMVHARDAVMEDMARRSSRIPFACVPEDIAVSALTEILRHAALQTRWRLEQAHARQDKGQDAARNMLGGDSPALSLETLLYWLKSGAAETGFAAVMGRMFQQWSGASRVMLLGLREEAMPPVWDIAFSSDDLDKGGAARNVWQWASGEPWIAWMQKHQGVLEKAFAPVGVLRWMEALKISYLIGLKHQDKLCGILGFADRKDRAPFGEKELRLLSDAAWKMAQVLSLAKPWKESKIPAAAAAIATQAPAAEGSARKQQMEIIGRMAMRSSHELKNCLVSIRTFTQLFPEKYADEQFRKDFYEVVSKEVERLNGLVEKLLFFAQPVQLKLSQEKISDLINDALTMFAPEETKNIQIHKVFGHKQPLLWVDRQQMRAVFYHLIQNSFQALAAGGKFVLITEDHPHPDFPDGVLAIRFLDTGRGMTMRDQEEPFEPFFSTKARGMGLGLTIARRIVEEHDGTIRLDSAKDKGTEVIVCLPRKIPPWAGEEQTVAQDTAETKP